ncbi:unnamed protein product [Effrenium voratum]|nr:unnamed protein product [Effrenium voratum]
MALCAPRASAHATSLAPDEGGAVNLPMPHPDKPGTSVWLAALAGEVQRLQRQVHQLTENSEALQKLVSDVGEGLASNGSGLVPRHAALKAEAMHALPSDGSGSADLKEESWAARSLRQSSHMHQGPQIEGHAEPGRSTASKFWHTRIDEDDVSPGGVDEADIRKVRADLLRVQFGRLDTTKKGYLSPADLADLAARFGEPLALDQAELLCRLSPVKSKKSKEMGLRFEAFYMLMSPDDESWEDEVLEAAAAAKRAVRAEAKGRLKAEQERKHLAHQQRIQGLFAMVFDLVTVAVIISNALVMGVSADIMPESNAWDVTEVGFFSFYALEYLIKLRMQGCGGYYTGLEATWNWFDNACLLISLIDLVFSYIVVTQSSGGSEPFMLMRMLRLARLARLVRLMRFRMFRELKLMVLGLFSGLRALAWAIVLLMFTIYTVGVLMRLISDLPEFASMPNAMFTLFRCFVTDGCVAYDGTPLPEKLRSDLGVPFFVFYILTTMSVWHHGAEFGSDLGCVLPAKVLKSQGQRKLKEIGDTSAAVCTELKLQFRRFLCEPTVASHRTLFSRLSESAQQKLSSLTDESFYRDQASRRKIAEATYRILQEDKVSISRDMFMMWLQDPEFTTMLEEADVDMSDKFRMFDILDVDMGGELSADELVTGLMQLRGDVSKGDIVAIMLKVRHLTYAIDEVQKSLKLGRNGV